MLCWYRYRRYGSTIVLNMLLCVIVTNHCSISQLLLTAVGSTSKLSFSWGSLSSINNYMELLISLFILPTSALLQLLNEELSVLTLEIFLLEKSPLCSRLSLWIL